MTMSPAAVTIGAATLSRSRLRRAQNAATATVSTSTTTDDRTAPITETTMKSAMEIDGPPINISHINLAKTASSAAVASDERIAADMF